MWFVICLAVAACSPATALPPAVATPEPSPSPSAAPSASPSAAQDLDAPVGKDLTQSLPVGDADRGAMLAQDEDCLGCHRNLPVGPPFEPDDGPPIGARAAERIQQPDYSGQAKSAEQYLLESIVSPGAFVVEDFPDGLMPDGFARLLSRQQAADLIAYLSNLQ